MRIASAILMGGLIAVAGSILYDTTFEVQELEGQLSRINRQIVAEREVIQVLKADWSLLNDINRIEQLSVRYLPELRPAEATQFVALKTVPQRTPAGAEPQVAALPGKAPALKPPVSTPQGDTIGSLIAKVGDRQ
jgi:hypothetical protein